MEKSIGLLKEVTDKVTGFIGVTVARHVYLNGCVRYAVQPKNLSETGLPLKVLYFDVQQLEYKPEDLVEYPYIEYNLGDTLRDSITGFEGVAVYRSDYLQSIELSLQPKGLNEKGDVKSAFNFVIDSLLPVPTVPPVVVDSSKRTGGDREDPVSSRKY